MSHAGLAQRKPAICRHMYSPLLILSRWPSLLTPSCRGPEGCPRLPAVGGPPREPMSGCYTALAPMHKVQARHPPCSFATPPNGSSCVPYLYMHQGHFHIPSVWLERICHNCHSEAAIESPVPNAFPALLLILLARLDAKQPSRRGVIARTVAALRALRLRECSAERQWELEVGLACRNSVRGARGGAEGGERRHWVPRVRLRRTVSGDV